MEQRQEFRLVFSSEGRSALDDFRITLKTTEPKTEDEIRSLVEYYIELNDRNVEYFTPGDAMDDLCRDKGWT